MSTHTRLFGSTSSRTLRCPAHFQRSANMPPLPTSSAAEEGTFLHGVAEDLLRGDQSPEAHPEWAGLTFDQQRIVSTHVTTVRELAARRPGSKLLVEFRTECPHLHPEWFGTADAVIIAPPRLTIADLKCGRIDVEVEDDDGDVNPQLASYAIGVMETLDKATRAKIREIELVVVQPRNGGVKTRLASLSEIKAMRDRLLEAGRLAESDDPPAKAGSWCTFCPAKDTCVTLREEANERARSDFAAQGMKPEELTGEELEEILDAAGLVKIWIAAVEQYATTLLEKDSLALDNWELVPKRPVRKWADTPSRVTDTLTAQGLDPSDLFKTELRTPAQIEQLARQQGVEIDLSELVVSESSGVKLTRI